MSQEPVRFLFALRIKSLRNAKGISLKQLSEMTGLSSSYLNEIEKAKKLPKMEKMMSLAKALEIDLELLLSKKVDKKLKPLVRFIESRFFNEFPLDVFGMSHHEVYDLMAHDPIKFSSLLSALHTMVRTYDINLKHIHLSALRVYQESHKNYFPEIEELAEEVRTKISKVTEEKIKTILRNNFHYEFPKEYLNNREGLEELRSFHIQKGEKKFLYTNNKLLPDQKLFVLAKELGYEVLQLDRPANFELKLYNELLNDFKASYFAGALIMGAKSLVEDMRSIFSNQEFKERDFKKLMLKYGASSEVFLNRLTQILPQFFNLNELFFLKIENLNSYDNLDSYDITKELHFSKIHPPHGIGLKEHYCRRWITITLLKNLEEQLHSKQYKKPLLGVQFSKMVNSSEDYFVVSLARPSRLKENQNSCLTLGILVDQNFKNKIKFWNSKNIGHKEVSQTCERCSKTDCKERAYPPVLVEKKEKGLKRRAAIEALQNAHLTDIQ